MRNSKRNIKEGIEVTLKDTCESLERYRALPKDNLAFEVKFFLISLSIIICTNIYIHKAYMNNYNFKLIVLLILYFSRRIVYQLWYLFRIREKLIFTNFNIILFLTAALLVLNVIYIFRDLVLNYSIYSLLPLFYLSLLQIPLFMLDADKRYENPPREMVRMIKKVSFLSLELCYYGIFIPVFFSIKYSPFFNAFAIFIYTILAWINGCVLLFAFHFFKKSAEFHFYAKSFGNWKRIKKADIPLEKLQKIKSWVSNQHYEKDTIVEFKGKYYIGLEERNYLEPNNLYANWLYTFFSEPKRIFWYILVFQGSFTIFQLMFYLLTQLNIFSINLSIMSWYIFYTIFTLSKRIKFIFNKN